MHTYVHVHYVMCIMACFINIIILFIARAKWQLGSMSHYVNSEVKGYQSLPEFPDEAPDATVRDVEVCTIIG